MSRKNFKVATTENGQTTKQDIKHKFATVDVAKNNTPTGKVKTMKDKEAIKAAREEQYKNFRINALKRRAKRMGLNEEQTKVKVEELIKQLNSSNDYDILIMFNPNDFNMVKQALMNEDIAWKLLVSSYSFLIGDDELLADLRKILPPSAKIYPHVKRKPPILPVEKPRVRGAKKHTKAEKKALAAAAKKARKAAKNIKGRNTNPTKKEEQKKFQKFMKRVNVAGMSKENRKQFYDKVGSIKEAWSAQKAKGGTTVHPKPKKGSTASKKASMTPEVRHHKYTKAAA